MRHRVLACDYDGTLATEGVCSDLTVQALKRVAAAGIRLVLVTGRTREELADVFDPGTLFEAIIVENGAVVIDVTTGKEELLGPRLPSRLVDEFARTGVDPLVVGRVLFSTAWSPASQAVRRDRQDRRRPPGRPQSRFGHGAARRDQQAHRSRSSPAGARGVGVCHSRGRRRRERRSAFRGGRCVRGSRQRGGRSQGPCRRRAHRTQWQRIPVACGRPSWRAISES